MRIPKVDLEHIRRIKFPEACGEISRETVKSILDGKRFCLNQNILLIEKFERNWSWSFFKEVPLESKDPDLRAVWEPSRLQHLTLLLHYLAKEPHFKGNKRIQLFAREKLLDWISDNPFLWGVHYISVMECALRVPVFLLALSTLDNLTATDRNKILQAMFEHAYIIRKRLSLYSSLGNHTVTEAMGLLVAGTVFRDSGRGRKWIRSGNKILREQCFQQILNDGGPIEESLSYHRFVLDLFWFAVDFIEQNALSDCSDLKTRLEQGEEFLSVFSNENNSYPDIGDNDNGHALAPGLTPRPRLEPIPISKEEPVFRSFPTTGYTAIRGKNGFRMTFDHGPLGKAPLFNHGHADALSITLSVCERPFFTDQGTYRYNGRKTERAYFKSTRAHNTVTIDGQDQAFQLTGFVWDDTYEASLTACGQKDGIFVMQAVHNGYAKGTDPVWHTRALGFYNANILIVKDTFSGEGKHGFELNYHLHPEVTISRENGWTILKNQGANIFVRLLEMNFKTLKGSEKPFIGWYSPEYGIMRETTVLQAFQEE
ncbi:MAG: alginate lyase family protein, partial [Deltaproteobacteria bacterium]|nr:alginate lyase family protein [Deltaproteobacteria bacterium]